MSGPSVKANSASRPRKRYRCSANAIGKASKVAASAVSEPNLMLNHNGSSHSGAKARSHQRIEKPRGGKNDRLPELNETAAVIRIGPSENT